MFIIPTYPYVLNQTLFESKTYLKMKIIPDISEIKNERTVFGELRDQIDNSQN